VKFKDYVRDQLLGDKLLVFHHHSEEEEEEEFIFHCPLFAVFMGFMPLLICVLFVMVQIPLDLSCWRLSVTRSPTSCEHQKGL